MNVYVMHQDSIILSIMSVNNVPMDQFITRKLKFVMYMYVIKLILHIILILVHVYVIKVINNTQLLENVYTFLNIVVTLECNYMKVKMMIIKILYIVNVITLIPN